MKVTRDNIFSTYKSQFGLNADDEMILDHTEVEGENFHSSYIQTHKGYPVESGMMNVIGKYNVINYANGYIVKNLSVNVANPVDESEAVQSAIASINAQVYDWQDIDRENAIRDEEDRPTYSSFPKGKLIIAQGALDGDGLGGYRLIWVFQINSIVPLSYNTVFVDALDGDVLYTRNTENEYTYSNSATGWTWYDGSFSNMRTRRCGSCTKWRQNDNYISTWMDGYTYPDNNNNWVENSYYGYSERMTAHSAHWAVQRAWDYYLYVHGRWGSDYNGKQVKIWPKTSNTVASYNVDNDGNDRIRLRADNTNVLQPSGTNPGVGYSVAQLDVMAHEYTHSMIRRSSNLNGFGDAGALAEGICDIFGMLVERYVTGSADWKIGDKMGLVRYMDTPNMDYHMGGANANVYSSTPSPSIFNGAYWVNTQLNNNNPPPNNGIDPTMHRNSGVLRKWFYLLSNGGTFNNVTVPGIGIDKAQEILYISFNWWLWSNLHYVEGAYQSAHATKHHYGECSPEHKAVIKAWKAVGITIPNICGAIVLTGPDVFHHQGSALLPPPEPASQQHFIKDVSDGDATVGNITWIYPPEWTVSIDENSNLKILSTTSFESKELKASVIENGSPVEVSKWVHFSDSQVIGDNNLPPNEKLNSTDRELITFEEDLVIFPNPAQNILSVATILPSNEATLSIYNIQGVSVLKEKINHELTHINVSNLSNGVYILDFKSDTFSKKIKFTIQK